MADDIYAILAQRARARADEESRLRNSIVAGTMTSPDEAYAKVNLSNKTGVPTELIDSADTMKQLAEMARQRAVPVDRLRGSRTADWAAAHPDNAAVSQTSFDPMMDTEDRLVKAEQARVQQENLKRFGDASPWRVALLNYAGVRLARGAANLLTVPGTLAETAAGALEHFGLAPSGTTQAFQDYRKYAAPSQGPLGVADAVGRSNKEYLDSQEFLTESLMAKDPAKEGEFSFNFAAWNPASVMGQANLAGTVLEEAIPMAASSAAGLLGAGMRAVPEIAALGKAAPYVSKFLTYATKPAAGLEIARTVQGVLEDGKQHLMQTKGMSEAQAAIDAAPGAALAGVFSFLAGAPLEAKMMEDLAEGVMKAGNYTLGARIKAWIRGAIGQGVKEGVQETANGIGEDLAKWITYQPELSIKEAAANAFTNFAGGMAMGHVAGGTRHGAGAWQAQQQKDFFNALGDAKLKSELGAQAGFKFNEWVNHITKDGPMKEVFIPAEQWTTYWQQQNEDPAAKAAEMGVAAEDYQAAVAGKSDLVIGTGALAEKLAGTEHFGGITPFVRTGMGGPTLAESLAQDRASKDMAAIIKESEAEPQSAERETLKQQILADLTLAQARFTGKQLEDVADGYARVLMVMSRKSNMTPAEVLKRNRLAITRGFRDNITQLGADPDERADETTATGLARDLADTGVQGAEAGRESGRVAEGAEPVRQRLPGQGASTPLVGWHGTEADPNDVVALKAEGLTKNQEGGMGPGLHISAGPQVAGEYAKGNPRGLWKAAIQNLIPFDAAQDTNHSVETLAQLGITAARDMTGFEVWELLKKDLGEDGAVAHLRKQGFNGLYYDHGGEDAWAVWDNASIRGSALTTEAQAAVEYERQGSWRDPVTGFLKTVAQQLNQGGVTLESAPGKDTLVGFDKLTEEQRAAYHVEKMKIAEKALTEAGIQVRTTTEGNGYWEGVSNYVTRFVVQPDQVQLAAQILADVVGDQDGVGWNKPVHGTKETNNALIWTFDRALTREEVLAIGSAVDGQPVFVDNSTPTILRVGAFDDDLAGKMEKIAEAVEEKLPSTAVVKSRGQGTIKSSVEGRSNGEEERARRLQAAPAGRPRAGRAVSDAAAAVQELNAKYGLGRRVNQSVTLRTGEETLSEFGINPGEKATVRVIAQALEERQQALYGKIAFDDHSAEAMDKIANWMVAEVLFEINPGSANVGWYSQKYQRALDIAAETRPSLRDPLRRRIFTVLTAITSDGAEVQDNFKMALELYDSYDASGDFTKGTGHARNVSNNLAIFKKLIAERGEQGAIDFLAQEKTVKELNKIARAEKIKFTSGYLVTETMPMAAVVLGPKVGVFFANLSGMKGYLTMDRWWSRTFNRYRGDIVQEVTDTSWRRLREMLGKPNLSFERTMEESEKLAAAAKAKRYKGMTDLERAGNNVWKMGFEKLNDAPLTASDRSFMIRTTERAQELLAAQGHDLTTADIQAVLWYYEKALYGHLGGSKKSAKSIGYDTAAELITKTMFQSGPAAAGVVTGVHYSPVAGLGELDPTKYGTGSPGAEQRRLRNAEPGLRSRTFFYEVKDGVIPPKEAVVRGSNQYTAQLTGIYDLDTDVLGLRQEYSDLNAMEQGLLDRGYRGYVATAPGMAARGIVVLGTEKVPVQPVPSPDNVQVVYQQASPQAATPEFKTWFGDSHVVVPKYSSRDTSPEVPLVVYHGTGAEFDVFQDQRKTVNDYGWLGTIETTRRGIFFAEDQTFAAGFAKSRGSQRVLPVYLSIQNPFYMTDSALSDHYAEAAAAYDAVRDTGSEEEVAAAKAVFSRMHGLYNTQDIWQVFDGPEGAAFVQWLKDQGYDGAKIEEIDPDTGDSKSVWVAFEPNQIKSATDNSGAFDPNNPSILFQSGAPETLVQYSETKLVDDGVRLLGTGKIADVESAAKAFTYLGQYPMERFDAIVTDDAGKPLAVVGGFKGSVSATYAHLDTLTNAAMAVPGGSRIWFGHNHPSGSSVLSSQDADLNRRLTELFDGSHLVPMGLLAVGTSTTGTHSYHHTSGKTGEVKTAARPKKTPFRDLIVTRQTEGRPNLNSPRAAKDWITNTVPGKTGILLLDAKGRPESFLTITDAQAKTLRNTGVSDALFAAGSATPFSSVILVSDASSPLSDRAVLNLKRFFTAMDKPTVDVIDHGVSQRATKATFDERSAGLYKQPAFHGSPYRFDKFTTDKIGTGEGNQTYGWGLYFAGEKEVAEYYRRTLGEAALSYDGNNFDDLPVVQQYAVEALWGAQGNKEMAKDDLKHMGIDLRIKTRELNNAVDELDFGKIKSGGQTYKVEIPDTGYLLWDKPLSEQPQDVQDALKNFDYLDGMETMSDGLIEDPSGRDMYEAIVGVLGSQKSASLALKDAGLSGIKYLDGTSRSKGEGNYNFVVFDDAAIQVLETYYQPNEIGPRGALRWTGPNGNRDFNLALLKNENKSTVFHELGHFYLEVMGDLASMPSATQEIRDDYARILKWLGVNDRGEIKTEHHEKFADAHLAYLLEGKAPVAEMIPAFKRFSNWLAKIGNKLMGVQVQMSDEVRAIFDRLYATDEELAAAAQQLPQLFATAQEMGISQAEFNVLKRKRAEALDQAHEKLLGKLMREIAQDDRDERRAAKKRIREEVTAEIDAQPEYQALAALAGGEIGKLNRGLILDAYGQETLNGLDRRVLHSDGELDPDAAAALTGFESGDALIEALTRLPARQSAIAAETNSRYRAEFPTALDDGTVREKALAAYNGSAMSEVLEAELKILSKQADKILAPSREAAGRTEARHTETVAGIRARAKAYIASKPLHKINPFQFFQAQQKASREAYVAALKKDYKTAKEAQERALLNHHLFREATKAKEREEDFRDWVKRNDSARVRANLALAGDEYLAQFDALRDRFSIEREPNKAIERKQTLVQFAENMKAQNKDAVIDPELLDETRTKNYREFTLAEMEGFWNALKNIKHLAYQETHAIVEGERIRRAEMLQEIVDGGYASTDKIKELMLGSDPKRKTAGFKLKNGIKLIDASLTKMELIAHWLDKGDVNGPFHRFIWNRIADAQTAEYDLHKKFTVRMADLLESLPKEYRHSLDSDTIDVPGMSRKWSRGQVLTMLLYSGQDVRRDKLVAGYAAEGMTHEGLDAAFAKLTAEDVKLANQVWAVFEELKPLEQALEKRLSGVAPEWDPARSFDIPAGHLTGGYFPLVADTKAPGEISKKQQGGPVGELFGNGYVRARTSQSHVQEITGAVYPLMLDYRFVMTAAMANQIKDLTHREAVLDIKRIFESKSFQKMAQEVLGEQYEPQFMEWLTYVVNERNAGYAAAISGWSNFLSSARANATVAMLGLKVTTIFMQILDPMRVTKPGPGMVKGRYMTQGLAKFLSGGAYEEAQEKSGEMRHLVENWDRDMRFQMQKAHGDLSLLSRYNIFAFKGLSLMAVMSSTVAWQGSYLQAKAEGADEKTAVRRADETIRLKLQVGNPKDLPAALRKGDFMKLITMFMGDATANYTMLRGLGKYGLEKLPQLTYAGLAMIGAQMLAELIRGAGPDDDEDPLLWALRKAMIAPTTMIPVVRDVGNAVDGVLEGNPLKAEYRFTPVLTVMDKGLKSLNSTTKLVKGEEEVEDWMIKMGGFLGFAFGVGGTSQAEASAKYLRRVQTGEENPDNVLELAGNTIRGKKREK